MLPFSEGDTVRIDIPDTGDPDYDQYHGEHGEIVKIIQDNAEEITGHEQDSNIYRIKVESGEIMDFRRYDLRPSLGSDS